MLTVRQCSANRGRVAGKLVSDHHPRLGASLAVKHTTQEALSGNLIAPLLDQDVQNNSVLVNGSPQPVTFCHGSSTQLRPDATCRRRALAVDAALAPNLVHH